MSLRLGTGSRGGKPTISRSRDGHSTSPLVEVVTLLGSNNRCGVGQRDDARHGRGSQAEAVDQDGATRQSARRASQSHDPARQRCVPRAVTPPPRPASLGLPTRCDPPETSSRLVRHTNADTGQPPPTRAVPFSPTDGICTPSPKSFMGAFIDNNGAVQHRPAPGGWWEWQARQVAAAHQASGMNHMGAGAPPTAVPPPNVHPAAFYAQYYAQLGIAGLAPYQVALGGYQVAPNGIVPPSPRSEERERRGFRGGPGDASSSFNGDGGGGSFPASADGGSARTSASSSPGASTGATGGFFRPSVPGASASPGTGFGFAFDRVQGGGGAITQQDPSGGAGKQGRRSSRGGRGSRAARARRRSAERAEAAGLASPGEDAGAGGE